MESLDTQKRRRALPGNEKALARFASRLAWMPSDSAARLAICQCELNSSKLFLIFYGTRIYSSPTARSFQDQRFGPWVRLYGHELRLRTNR
jgi:hypothetical protein